MFAKGLLAPALLFLLVGCATQPPKRRYFWPPLPDEPKIEHLGSYQTSADFPKKTGKELFLKSFLGEEADQVLLKPWGIASDGEGKVYITDAAQASIIIFDLKNYTIDSIEDVRSPYGIEIDKKGRLFVTSGASKNVLIYGPDGTPFWSFGEDILERPAGIAINNDLGLVYVVDVIGHDIKVFSLTGDFLFAIGRRGREDGEFNFPTDVDISSRGELVVADSMNARIQVLGSEGNFIRAFGRRGTGLHDFQIMKGIAVDSEDHIYVTDAMGSHFKVFSMEGELLLVVGGPYSVGRYGMAPGGFNLPMDISIDKNDTIFVVDQQNYAFQVFQYMNEEYLREHPIE